MLLTYWQVNTLKVSIFTIYFNTIGRHLVWCQVLPVRPINELSLHKSTCDRGNFLGSADTQYMLTWIYSLGFAAFYLNAHLCVTIYSNKISFLFFYWFTVYHWRSLKSESPGGHAYTVARAELPIKMELLRPDWLIAPRNSHWWLNHLWNIVKYTVSLLCFTALCLNSWFDLTPTGNQ